MNSKHAVFFSIILVSFLTLIVYFAAGAVINPLTPAEGNWTDVQTPTFTFNYTDSNVSNMSCELWIGSTAYAINASTLNNTLTTLLANATVTEGIYNWTVNCTNATDTNISSLRIITIDATAPSVNMVNTSINISDNTPNFNFNYTDALSPNTSCVLWIGSSSYNINASTLNNTPTELTANGSVSDGVYSNVNVTCTDLASNSDGSTAITVKIDTNAPIVSINSPAPNNWTYDSTTDILFNFTDNYSPTASCTVWVNDTEYGINSSVINNTATTITINGSGLSDNIGYALSVNCTDDVSNEGESGDQTLNIDTLSPVVTLMNSSFNSTDFTPEIWFNYTDSLSSTANCILYFDSVASGNNASVINATNTMINTTKAEGTYSVNLTCTDSAGNLRNSSIITVGVDYTAPAVSITLPANNRTNYSSSQTIYFNATVTEATLDVFDVIFNISNASGSVLLSADDNNAWWNSSISAGSLSEGLHVMQVLANDTIGNLNNTQTISFTVDNSAPKVNDLPTQNKGLLGFGILNGDTDEFFSIYTGNNVINLSINLTDDYTGVKNVTFDMTDPCTGATVVQTSSSAGLWWANCTVDAEDANFEYLNITFTACDLVGNCNTSLFRSVMIYNFTLPTGQAGVMQFGSGTSNLSQETNLEDVNYVLNIELNGSLLPGTPWTDFQETAVFNFTSLNFTSSTIAQRLAGLAGAINISIRAPGSYGDSRIYVNTTFFTELNTTTIITLYNLPFASQPNITADPDAAGGVNVISWVGSTDYPTSKGNLTFNVSGFSGYNFTDVTDPLITIHTPVNSSLSTNFVFNTTFNGTGTRINNASISVNITNSTGTVLTYTYDNMTCVTRYLLSAEAIQCNMTPSLADDTYNVSVYAEDYGGASGNSATALGNSITIDTSGPIVSINSPSPDAWTPDNTTEINFTFTDAASTNASCVIWVNTATYGINATTLNNIATVVSINGSGLADATNYTLWVNCTDPFNNSGASSTQSLNVDTVVPTVNSLTPADNNVTSVNTPSFTFNFTDALSPNASCGLWIAGNSYDINISTLNNTLTTLTANTSVTDGNHSWNVTCTDLATNAAASTARYIVIDAAPPTVNLLNSSFNTTDNTPSITFNFSDKNSASASCTLYFSGTNVSTNSSVINWTNTILTPSSNQSDGGYNVTVNCTDNSSNVNASDTIVVIIDTTGPTVTINNPSNGARTYDNTTDINYTFTDAVSTSATCTIWINDTSYGTNTTTNDTATVVTINSTLNESSYSLLVNCTDNLSNIGTSGAQTLDIDQTIPSILTLDPSGTSSGTTTGTATITATTDENATCWYSTSNFTAENVTDATVMDGAATTTSTFAIGYSADGTIGPYYVSCSDLATNNMTTSNSTGAIAVSVTEGSSGGGGGGGGGGGSSNPTTSQTWNKVTPGAASIMKINKDDFGVKEIHIEVNNPAQSVKITVVKLSGQPAAVTKEVTGKVYKYLELKKSNLEDSNIKGAIKIKFQVTRGWLLKEGLDAKNIVLKRFTENNERWEELKTTLLSIDNKLAYYEAETPGFSYFVIGEKGEPEPKAAETVEEETEQEEVVEEEPVTVEEPVLEGETAPEEEVVEDAEPKKPKLRIKIPWEKIPWMTLLYVLIAIIVIGGIFALVHFGVFPRKKRKIEAVDLDDEYEKLKSESEVHKHKEEELKHKHDSQKSHKKTHKTHHK